MNDKERKERIKEQNRKAVQKYREKTVSFAVKYSAVDAIEGKRLKAYLNQTGQSANSYIKGLIKADLDSKGIEYVNEDWYWEMIYYHDYIIIGNDCTI